MKLLSENYIFYMRFRKGITYFFHCTFHCNNVTAFIFAHKCIQKSGRNYS